MPNMYNILFTGKELKLVIQNLTESAHRWRLVCEDSPFPDAVEAARTEWLSLISLLEKIDPPLGV